MDLTGTKTLKNIEDSFLNESKAIISYLISADIATLEGNEEAADLFKKMAKNEIEHAKKWFKYLHDTNKDTQTNLNDAAFAENAEWKTSYPEAAIVAKEEGLINVADMFERISSIECDHERRFVELVLSQSEKKTTEQKAQKQYFCLFCGFPSNSTLEICPVCGGADAFLVEND